MPAHGRARCSLDEPAGGLEWTGRAGQGVLGGASAPSIQSPRASSLREVARARMSCTCPGQQHERKNSVKGAASSAPLKLVAVERNAALAAIIASESTSVGRAPMPSTLCNRPCVRSVPCRRRTCAARRGKPSAKPAATSPKSQAGVCDGTRAAHHHPAKSSLPDAAPMETAPTRLADCATSAFSARRIAGRRAT